MSFLDKKRRDAVIKRYIVDWDQYETISREDECSEAEKTVTEDAVKVSGRDEVCRTGQEETAENLSEQFLDNSMESDEERPEDIRQTTAPEDLTELFTVSENEELLQRYYEKLMKEEEENRQFEVYGQDREQQLCQSSLFDSDADSGCFNLSIDGFGITDD